MNTVLFDLGKVLLDWDPRYFYHRFFENDPTGLEHFVREVVAQEWIVTMDAGTPASIAIEARCRAYPEHAQLIALWMQGWPSMLRGEIPGTLEILESLRAKNRRLYALTNFSAETWPLATARIPSLAWFEDVIVSGEHGLIKPDRRIYELAISRCRLDPSATVFIDDTIANVEAARACGLHARHFVSPQTLLADLRELGLL